MCFIGCNCVVYKRRVRFVGGVVGWQRRPFSRGENRRVANIALLTANSLQTDRQVLIVHVARGEPDDTVIRVWSQY